MNEAAPMQARIERLKPGDGERWRKIRLAALSEAPYAFGTTYADAVRWPAARWEAQVLEFANFVAVIAGHDVGVARGAPHVRRGVRELVSMWITPSARGRGVGAQLIESVAAWASESRATLLVLDVVADNAHAIALYERSGFRRVDDAALVELAVGELRFSRSLAPPIG